MSEKPDRDHEPTHTTDQDFVSSLRRSKEDLAAGRGTVRLAGARPFFIRRKAR